MEQKIKIIKDDKPSGLKKGQVKKIDKKIASHLIKKKIATIASIIILMIAFAIPASAQMKTSKLSKNKSYVFSTTDYTLTNTTARYWQIETQPEWYSAFQVGMTLDSASGDHTNVQIICYTRLNAVDTWTSTGDTVNWVGSTADTNIIITNGTEIADRHWKILFTGTGTGTTTIDSLTFKRYNGMP